MDVLYFVELVVALQWLNNVKKQYTLQWQKTIPLTMFSQLPETRLFTGFKTQNIIRNIFLL